MLSPFCLWVPLALLWDSSPSSNKSMSSPCWFLDTSQSSSTWLSSSKTLTLLETLLSYGDREVRVIQWSDSERIWDSYPQATNTMNLYILQCICHSPTFCRSLLIHWVDWPAVSKWTGWRRRDQLYSAEERTTCFISRKPDQNLSQWQWANESHLFLNTWINQWLN